MTRAALILALYLLASCGHDVPPDFAPYVARFEAAGGLKVQGVRIEFGRLLGTEAGGECLEFDATHKLIVLDEAGWKADDDTGHEIILFHELGHCALGRVHLAGWTRPDPAQSGWLTSIMAPTTPWPAMYQAHRDYYLAELFGTQHGEVTP